MERSITRVKPEDSDGSSQGQGTVYPAKSGAFVIDLMSMIGGGVGTAGFFALAMLSLSLSKVDTTLASIWVPNAAAVAFLLRARFASEVPFYIGAFTASILTNIWAGTPAGMAIVFSAANVVDIAVVVGITRRGCGSRPDMTHMPDLARFVWAGGIVGPAISATIVAIAITVTGGPGWNVATGWLLTDAMGMVLVVPATLLTFDAWKHRRAEQQSDWLERTTLLGGGIACVFLVFHQDVYPLLFLIPPIALLNAFRLGSLGTAIYVIGVAIVASLMTWADFGPIARAGLLPSTKVQMVQAFVAANFLTGLPVAAILAGKKRIVVDLEKRKRQLDLLAQNITDAVLRFDLEGRCTYASPSVRDVLAEVPETFLGSKPTDRMHEDAADRITLAHERLLSGKSEKERFTYRRFHDAPDGSAVFIEADCAIALHPYTGEQSGFVVSARDVTARVDLEQLLTRARRHAENAARAKSEFLANMSHEIRTPMNGVLGFAELMLESDLDDDQRRQTEMIVRSGRSMMLLLNDILDLSKIEAGQISINRDAIDLHETLEECAALHRPNATKKGLDLQFERDHNGDKQPGETTNWVLTDGLRVRQIVLNLVGNAVKFTESGMIHVSYRIDDEQFSVRVMDTGIGISASRLTGIFKPFTQGESDTARRFGGTGLGLTISRQLAELLGGFIDVESEAGVGSCFTLTLPAKRSAPKPQPKPETAPITLEDLPHHARILLAEDHDVNRILVTEMLERCGQSVATAHDGNEAISMVIDSMMRGSPFDLVLMDIQMPGCDGYAATRAIRSEGISPQMLPIVALTANAFPEDIANARDAGMQAHLAKPLEFAQLARVLQRWLPTQIIEDQAEIAAAAATGRADRQRMQNAGSDASGHAPNAPPQPKTGSISHTAEVTRRWLKRRAEAVEAVRLAVQGGSLEGNREHRDRDQLARLVHKLAGTAAMFGEEKLGERAAALERALRTDIAGLEPKALAHELLELADQGPPDAPVRRQA